MRILPNMLEPLSVSFPTLRRLPLYRRVMAERAAEGDEWISSEYLARRLGFQSIQIRKDMSQAGIEGRSKLGFPIAAALGRIEAVLGMGANDDVFVIGAGALAEAVLADESLASHGLKAIAVFDPDPALEGAAVGATGMRALHTSRLGDLARRMGVRAAVFTVGEPWAREAAASLGGTGIRAVLDLSPCKPEFPEGLRVARSDIGAVIAALLASSRD